MTSMTAMKVFVDNERCQGHGRCYVLAPDVFESDDDGYGRVISEDVPPGSEASAETGRASCPERAISIEV
jgi:ferredoxin